MLGLNFQWVPDSFSAVCSTQSALIWPLEEWRWKEQIGPFELCVPSHSNTNNKRKHDKEVRSVSRQLASVLFDPAIMIMPLTDCLWNAPANPDWLQAAANYMSETLAVRRSTTKSRQKEVIWVYLSITPPSLMALFQSFRVAFPARCTNCLGLMSSSLNC